MACTTNIGAVRVTTSDFNVNSPMLIGLYRVELTIVLFHTQNDASVNIARSWHRIAAHTVGPQFAICDILMEPMLMRAFNQVKTDASHPLHPYSQHAWPLILAYRNGLPVAMYKSSDISQEKISFWALSV